MTDFSARKSRLFFISAMALYTEVVLIRWMSAEILGGALEAFSIFFGIKAMALLAIAVYGAAAFSHRGQASEALPEPVTVSHAAE